MSEKERDEKSIKCSECGGFVMLQNLISYETIDGQHRPVYELPEQVSLSAICISCHARIPLKGILVVSQDKHRRRST